MLCCWLRPTNPQTALTPSSAAASNTRSMKSCFFLRDRRIVVQQVVEVADVGEADAGRLQRRLRPAVARAASNGVPQVQGVRDRIEHRFGRHVGLGSGAAPPTAGCSSRPDLLRELEPVLDRLVGIGIADLARRELLQRRGQDADLHELRFERSMDMETSLDIWLGTGSGLRLRLGATALETPG